MSFSRLKSMGSPRGHPAFVVLSYDSGLSSAQATIDAFGRETEQLPDLLCVLDVGLVAGRAGVLTEGQGDGWTCGLALAQVSAGDGSWDYLAADPTQERVHVEGQMVAVVDHGNGHFAADPGRALLKSPRPRSRRPARRCPRCGWS